MYLIKLVNQTFAPEGNQNKFKERDYDKPQLGNKEKSVSYYPLLTILVRLVN